MPTEKDDSNLTRSDVEALITDIVGKAYSRSREDTTKEINGAIAANINPVSKSLSDISKQLESFKEISTKVSATEAQMAEIFTALQAPDEDPTQPATPQAIDVEAITAKIKADLEESTAKQYLERIQGLEKVVETERQEKDKIRQEQIEGDRNNALITSLKKIAPELNLFPNLEKVIMDNLANDKVLEVSEDGKAWLAKIKREDPYIKGKIVEETVPASDDILKSIISGSYSIYQQPRAGAGVNAAPTQSYNPANRKITDTTSAADIQKGFASNDQGMIDEIAAMIASGQ
jgi:predicted nucleic acid-binding Zn ribbon protein